MVYSERAVMAGTEQPAITAELKDASHTKFRTLPSQAKLEQRCLRLPCLAKGYSHLVEKIVLARGVIGFDEIVRSAVCCAYQLIPNHRARQVREALRTARIDGCAEHECALMQCERALSSR